MILNIQDNTSLSSEDISRLFIEIGGSDIATTIERKKPFIYPLSFSNLYNYITTHPDHYKKLTRYQNQLSLLFFNQHRINEIYQRPSKMQYLEQYQLKNGKSYPIDSCINIIKRYLITHDPYPYKYDYECKAHEETQLIIKLFPYIKLISSRSESFNKVENPMIQSIKRHGEMNSARYGNSALLKRGGGGGGNVKRKTMHPVYGVESLSRSELVNNTSSPRSYDEGDSITNTSTNKNSNGQMEVLTEEKKNTPDSSVPPLRLTNSILHRSSLSSMHGRSTWKSSLQQSFLPGAVHEDSCV